MRTDKLPSLASPALKYLSELFQQSWCLQTPGTVQASRCKSSAAVRGGQPCLRALEGPRPGALMCTHTHIYGDIYTYIHYTHNIYTQIGFMGTYVHMHIYMDIYAHTYVHL